MDLICTCCGEPWDIEYALHHDQDEFNREGGLIRSCPCCHGEEPEDMTDDTRNRLRAVAEVAELLGDDIDGLAAFIDDLDALEL